MARLNSVQNNFLAGELDPLLIGRTDTEQYDNGLEKARNVLLIPQGGATRRDGGAYIDEVPSVMTRETGMTITLPNGGTPAYANDGTVGAFVLTTTGISTTNPFVVAHYDLLSAKTIRFADVRDFSLNSSATTTSTSKEWYIQYSYDDIAWNNFGPLSIAVPLYANRVTRRFHSATPITARYWRFVRIGTTDYGVNDARLGDFNLLTESATLSETKCVDFVFSTTQTYKLIFSDKCISVYKDNVAQVYIRTEYDSADLVKLNYAARFDTMILFHEDFPMTYLKRGDSDTDWNHGTQTITSNPIYQFTQTLTSPAATITPSAVGGISVITASAGVFTGNDINQLIRGNGGVGRIIKYTSPTQVSLTMLTPFYDVTAMVTTSWQIDSGHISAWGAGVGYPRCGTFHQQRLWIGGSRDLPQTLFGSKIDNFFDFDLGTNLDDEGIQVTLDTDEVAAINHLYSGAHLQMFTSSGEFFVPTSSDNPITPNTVTVLKSTKFGSLSTVPVQNIDGSTIFITRAGKTIREAIFNDTQKAYNSPPLNILASHLISSPVDSTIRKSVEANTADYYMVVNSDGTVATLNKTGTQSGWSLLEFDGQVKSIATELDEVFYTIERTINGAAVIYAEYFNPLHVLDSSIRITTGLPTDTFSGLDHLEGETIEVIADGNRLTPVTVVSGSVTIERDATTYVEFGKRFKASGDGYTLKTMPIEKFLDDGTMLGKKKRVVETTLRVYETKSLKVNGNRVSFRQLGDSLLDLEAPSYTGQKVIEGMLGYSDDASIEIGDDVPQPATINAIAYKVSV